MNRLPITASLFLVAISIPCQGMAAVDDVAPKILTVTTPTTTTPGESFPVQRKRFAVDRTLRIDQIEPLLTRKFMGAKFLELRATVKGSYSSPGMSGILLEHPKADPVALEAETVPEWLVGREVEARFLVRAERSEAAAPLRLYMIAACPIDAAPDLIYVPPKVASKAASQTATKSPTATRKLTPISSRSSVGRQILPANQVTPIYAGFIKQRNRRLSNAEAYRIAESVVSFSVGYGVDARLIMSIIMVESGFNPYATSRKGAMGLGQLMPKTAAGLGVRSAYDSAENLYGMIKHVRRLLDKYYAQTGDSQRTLHLSLAAYNAGEGNVKKYGGIPPFRETQNYVRKIVDIFAALTGSR
jgi:soluble lytic murein transglycosylase-like protein